MSKFLSYLSPLIRLALGGLLIFSGYMKLGLYDFHHFYSAADGRLPIIDPRDFAASIEAFKLGLAPHLVTAFSFIVPWTEVIAGLCVLIGLWTRPAALIIGALMIAFSALIVSAILRTQVDAKCSCFGAIKFLCEPTLGPCHLIRNGILLAAAAFLVLIGPGPLAFDNCARCKPQTP